MAVVDKIGGNVRRYCMTVICGACSRKSEVRKMRRKTEVLYWIFGKKDDPKKDPSLIGCIKPLLQRVALLQGSYWLLKTFAPLNPPPVLLVLNCTSYWKPSDNLTLSGRLLLKV